MATSSAIWISTIAIVNPSTWYPERGHGYAIIVEPTAPITYDEIVVIEVNGGIAPLKVLAPSPGVTYNSALNRIDIRFPHY